MSYLNDLVLDSGLTILDTLGDRLDICSTEPTTYAQATTTYTLGNKTSLSVGAPAPRTPSGRKVTVAQINDGAVTGDGTAAFWAISDVSESMLLAAGALSSGQVVTTGNTFTLSAFDIGIPGPA